MSERLRGKCSELEMLKKEKAERHGESYTDPEDLVAEQLREGTLSVAGLADAELEASLQKQLSLHILGPLLSGYEQELAALRHELLTVKGRLRTQSDDAGCLLDENDRLREQLLVKTRELAALSKERGDHGAMGTEETIELRNRAHLLTEENEVLF